MSRGWVAAALVCGLLTFGVAFGQIPAGPAVIDQPCPTGADNCPPAPPVPCRAGQPCAYQCPSGPYLNCMPINTCPKDYVDWVKRNCPGVEIIY